MLREGSLYQEARRCLKRAGQVLRDLPAAVLREYDYCTGTRRSAILSLTWRCTSHCVSCTAWRRKDQRHQELTAQQWLDAASKLLKMGVQCFELFGGDVLLRKDVLFPLCRTLHAAGAEIHIATNCNLLDEQTAQVFAETVHSLYLSTDGLDDVHDTIRGTPGTFSRLAEARTRVLEARGRGRTPKLVCNTTIGRDNAAMAYDIAAFALEEGYDEIDFEYIGEFDNSHVACSCVDGLTPSPIFLRSGDSRLLTAEQVPALRQQLRRTHSLTGKPSFSGRPFKVVTLNVDVLPDRHLIEGTVPWRRCFVERSMVIIDPFGNIVPCLFFDNISAGNVLEGALDHSFETAKRAHFRQLRQDGKLELCRHCIMSVVRNRTGWDILRRAYIQGGQISFEEPKNVKIQDSRVPEKVSL